MDKIYLVEKNFWYSDDKDGIKIFLTAEDALNFLSKNPQYKPKKLKQEPVEVSLVLKELEEQLEEINKLKKEIEDKYNNKYVYMIWKNGEVDVGSLLIDFDQEYGENSPNIVFGNIRFGGCINLYLDYQKPNIKPKGDNPETYIKEGNEKVKRKTKKEMKTIYFIQEKTNKSIKIGITKDINSRFSSLKTSSPFELELLATIKGTEKEEKELHNKFKEHRLNGEWFEPCQKLLDYIEEIKCL